MKKLISLLTALACVFLLAACAPQSPSETPARNETQPRERLQPSCGHEAYLELIGLLEKQDFNAARDMIDKLETDAMRQHMETIPEGQSGKETTPPATVDPGKYPDAVIVELDRHNLLMYFDLRDDYIFEDQITCYQNLQLKPEYADRLLELQGVTVEISYFDAAMFGEPDRQDQLFYTDSYQMTTGELVIREIDITANGEGYIMLGSYDARKGCIDTYAVDIAIREATGALILEKN